MLGGSTGKVGRARLAALSIALLLCGGVWLWPVIRLQLLPNAYDQVVSIEAQTDYRDATLMGRAWHLPVARAFDRAHYVYQDNQSFCGPASAANLLRSIGIEATQQGAIDGTKFDPWFGVLIGGMTIDDLAELLALKTDRSVEVLRDLSLAAFRKKLAAANDPAFRMIVNFHRGPLFGRGHGHFSPVLAYLDDQDLVLVGDVNADYKPFLVSAERLWRATDTIDDETGQERGLIIVHDDQGTWPRDMPSTHGPA